MSTGATEPPRRPFRLVREGLLWGFALVGVVCLLSTALALIFGMTPLIFRSGSMSPTIPTGSLAIAVETSAAQLVVGDVVSVEWGDGTRVTHRLVDVLPGHGDARTLVTKGDANRMTDTETVLVESADRVIWHVPEVGYWLEEVMKPQYVFGIGLTIGALLVFAFRSPTERTHGRRSGVISTGAVLGLVAVGVLGAPSPTPTLASFNDTNATAGTFATGSVHAPTDLDCVVTGGLLSPKTINLNWNAAANGVTAGSYLVTWRPLTGGAVGSKTVTGTSTTVAPTLLTLAVTYEFSVQAVSGTWLSPGITTNVLATTNLLVACL